MKKQLMTLLGLFLSSVALAQVNLNTATSQELQTVNGIGKSRAEAIVRYREEHGAFKSVDELSQIRGIGSGVTLQKIREQVTVTPNGAAKPANRNAQPATR